MTKRVMTKKFMKETGTDKKTAMEYLRLNNWNYGQAKTMYLAPKAINDLTNFISRIDWDEIFAKLGEALQRLTEQLKNAIQSEAFSNTCKAIVEEEARHDNQRSSGSPKDTRINV